MTLDFWKKYNETYENKEYIYKDYLQAAIKILNPRTILEIGAGLQRNKQYIDKKITYLGLDLIDGYDITTMDVERISQTFDLILSTGFLCHIPQMKRDRVMRFMKTNGKNILMIEPYSNPEQMNRWHDMNNMLWTVNPYNYDFKLVTLLEGGYSLAIF